MAVDRDHPAVPTSRTVNRQHAALLYMKGKMSALLGHGGLAKIQLNNSNMKFK